MTPETTNKEQNKINFVTKRLALRVFNTDEDRECKFQEPGKSKDPLPSPQSGAASPSRGGADKGSCSVPADLEEFHRRIYVGAMIEAEMDDTKGGTVWIKGQVQSLNAARATFSVRFRVQNDNETGEWIDEYQWEELGREWRFAALEPKVEEQQQSAAVSKVLQKSTKLSQHRKGVVGAEEVQARDQPASSQKVASTSNGDTPELDEAIRKLRTGLTIEAEMDDSNGGTEWIRGIVVSAKKTTKSFTVKFNVRNNDESGEWTEEYRFLFPLFAAPHVHVLFNST